MLVCSCLANGTPRNPLLGLKSMMCCGGLVVLVSAAASLAGRPCTRRPRLSLLAPAPRLASRVPSRLLSHRRLPLPLQLAPCRLLPPWRLLLRLLVGWKLLCLHSRLQPLRRRPVAVLPLRCPQLQPEPLVPPIRVVLGLLPLRLLPPLALSPLVVRLRRRLDLSLGSRRP